HLTVDRRRDTTPEIIVRPAAFARKKGLKSNQWRWLKGFRLPFSGIYTYLRCDEIYTPRVLSKAALEVIFLITQGFFTGFLLPAYGDSCILCNRIDRECHIKYVRFIIDIAQINYPYRPKERIDTWKTRRANQ
ncbi:MAG TPA: hypothetical protein VMX36_14120, partial [Sedimentisphaerales bacterium]|nr:hypothetical protein [Sedimentisphaerales bacterium]